MLTIKWTAREGMMLHEGAGCPLWPRRQMLVTKEKLLLGFCQNWSSLCLCPQRAWVGGGQPLSGFILYYSPACLLGYNGFLQFLHQPHLLATGSSHTLFPVFPATSYTSIRIQLKGLLRKAFQFPPGSL